MATTRGDLHWRRTSSGSSLATATAGARPEDVRSFVPEDPGSIEVEVTIGKVEEPVGRECVVLVLRPPGYEFELALTTGPAHDLVNALDAAIFEILERELERDAPEGG